MQLFLSTVRVSLTVGWTVNTNHNEVPVDLHFYLSAFFYTRDLQSKIIGELWLSKPKIAIPIVTCELYFTESHGICPARAIIFNDYISYRSLMHYVATPLCLLKGRF